MASVYHLIATANSFPKELIRENARLELPIKRRHFAAIAIQRCYRGYQVRQMIKLWNRTATVIQSVVRGWIVRWHRVDYLQAYLLRMEERDLNQNATKIQAYWRGYKVRKQLEMPIKQLVEMKRTISRRSQLMRDIIRQKFKSMHKGFDSSDYTDEDKAMIGGECKKWVLFILFKTHHLMRTQCREGIYSIHDSSELSNIEKWMKRMPMKKYISELRKLYDGRYPKKEIIQYIFSGDKRMRHLENLFRTRNKSHEVRDVVEIDRNIHEKQFDLYKPPKDKPYQKSMLSAEEYVRVKNPLERSFSQYSTDFDLFVHQPPVPVPPNPPPYYIDFWEQQCNKHKLDK